MATERPTPSPPPRDPGHSPTRDSSDSGTPHGGRLLLGLPGRLLFPGEVSTVDVRRSENVEVLRNMERDARVLVGALDAPDVPASDRIHHVLPVATLARLVGRTRLAGGGMRIVLQGIRRVSIEDLTLEDDCLWSSAGRLEPVWTDPRELEEKIARLVVGLEELRTAPDDFAAELADTIPLHGMDAERITDLVASALTLSYEDQARLMIENDPTRRLDLINRDIEARVLRARAERSIDERVAERVHRETLERRIQALRDELGEPNEHQAGVARLRREFAERPLPSPARQAIERELQLLARTTPGSPTAARLESHLEWALELPWAKPIESTETRSFAGVLEALEESHVGLADVKQRIAEILAIRHLGGGARGTVLCFAGPPGTGKSSMARAVATALGRSFLTIPVGAKTEEYELIGSSRRREGAAPGAILSGLHRAGTSDPVVLLDEIDKLSLGGEGTAAGALLGLLDPEQSSEFLDHYLGVPFDLSRCLFLTTAIDLDEIPESLLDRMEIVRFEGYAESEKSTIAREHLLPRARAHAGIAKNELRLTPAALRTLIRSYTEEAGVRHLARLLVALARKAAVDVVNGGDGIVVRKGDLLGLLGPRTVEEEVRLRRPTVGLATGLAWTSAGGALLPIETIVMAGQGRTILTGMIGEVMQESVQTVLSLVRTSAATLGFEAAALQEVDLHLHFPSAATPKDGPSAGTAITAAIVSLLTRRPVRHDVALTGEVSLLGAVLPVGGVREKLLAAIRCGIREVIVPARNSDEVRRLPEEILEGLTIHLVNDVAEVLEIALRAEGGARRPAPLANRGRRRVAHTPRRRPGAA